MAIRGLRLAERPASETHGTVRMGQDIALPVVFMLISYGDRLGCGIDYRCLTPKLK